MLKKYIINNSIHSFLDGIILRIYINQVCVYYQETNQKEHWAAFFTGGQQGSLFISPVDDSSDDN